MSIDFYDDVAKKFGGFAYGKQASKITPNVTGGLPDNVFLEQLIKLSGPDKVALDIGCGDGKMAISLSGSFNKIVGIDHSEGLLRIAQEKKKELGSHNVTFLNMDAKNITLSTGVFDVAYSYRSPLFYKGIYKVLKDGGSYVALIIGERDFVEIKKLFHKDPNLEYNGSKVLDTEVKRAEELGFDVIFSKEIFYDDYFTSEDDLNLYLQKVPLIPSYDPIKDKELLRKSTKKFATEKGIKLARHRIVLAFKKP